MSGPAIVLVRPRGFGAGADLVLVAGDASSSNSARMVEVARGGGVRAELIDDAAEILPEWVAACRAVGVSAGASAPEALVKEIVARLAALGAGPVHEHDGAIESESFALPAQLRERLESPGPPRNRAGAAAAPGSAA